MHEMAAALWLRTGMQNNEDFSRRQLLTSCARVLARNERVVGKARRAILSLKQEGEVDAERVRQLEAIIMQDRSMLMISDRVRGAMGSFGTDDLKAVVEEFAAAEREKGIALGQEEIAEEYEELKRENAELLEKNQVLTSNIERQIRDMEEDDTHRGREISGLQSRLDSIDRVDQERFEALIDEVNSRLRRRRIVLSALVLLFSGGLVVLAAMGQIASFTGFEGGQLFRWGTLTAGLVVGGGFFVGDLTLRLFGVGEPIDRRLFGNWALRRVTEISSRRGLSHIVNQHSVRYGDRRITLSKNGL